MNFLVRNSWGFFFIEVMVLYPFLLAPGSLTGPPPLMGVFIGIAASSVASPALWLGWAGLAGLGSGWLAFRLCIDFALIATGFGLISVGFRLDLAFGFHLLGFCLDLA